VRPLSLADVKELLRRLAPLADRIVLVGGQAVNFWAERYLPRLSPELRAVAPFTSKDIDFAPRSGGGREEMTEMAERLEGRVHVVSIEDHGTANAGTVTFVDPEGEKRTIDVLRTLHGLELPEVSQLSQALEIDTTLGEAVEFRVMHPVHCLESRTHNTADLPGYDTEHALNQLRAAVAATREYLREILDAGGDVREVLSLNERIYRFRRYAAAAKKVLAEHGIDVIEAVLVDPRLPKKFHTEWYPRMRQTLGLPPAV
jgi:hypothetical protein